MGRPKGSKNKKKEQQKTIFKYYKDTYSLQVSGESKTKVDYFMKKHKAKLFAEGDRMFIYHKDFKTSVEAKRFAKENDFKYLKRD